MPAAARASTGCEDEHSTCPTSARAPLSHRKRGSGTWHKRRDHWRLRRERCSQLLHTSRWRSRLRRTNAAATLQHFVGVMPDLERGVARAASHSRFTKRKHRCGAQARTASLRGAFARIFGKANVSPSCGCNASAAGSGSQPPAGSAAAWPSESSPSLFARVIFVFTESYLRFHVKLSSFLSYLRFVLSGSGMLLLPFEHALG